MVFKSLHTNILTFYILFLYFIITTSLDLYPSGPSNWPRGVGSCAQYRKAYMIQQASFCTEGKTFDVPINYSNNDFYPLKCFCQAKLGNFLGAAICYGVDSKGKIINKLIDESSKIIVIMPSNKITDIELSEYLPDYRKSYAAGINTNVQLKVLNILNAQIIPFLNKLSSNERSNILFLGHGFGGALARVAAHYLKGVNSTNIVKLYTQGEPPSMTNEPSSILNYDVRSVIYTKVSGNFRCYSWKLAGCAKVGNFDWTSGDEPPSWSKNVRSAQFPFVHPRSSNFIITTNKLTKNVDYRNKCDSKNSWLPYDKGLPADFKFVPGFVACGKKLNLFSHNVYQYMGMISNCNCYRGDLIFYKDICWFCPTYKYLDAL